MLTLFLFVCSAPCDCDWLCLRGNNDEEDGGGEEDEFKMLFRLLPDGRRLFETVAEEVEEDCEGVDVISLFSFDLLPL